MGKATTCVQCDFVFLGKPLEIVRFADQKQASEQPIIEPFFRGKFLFHQPAKEGSTPSAQELALNLSPQVEVSYDVQEIRKQRCDLHVVLDDIRSQWNVGSIFRTADAAGWKSVSLTGITACPPSPGVMKCALGATEFVDWTYRAKCTDAMTELSASGATMVALELTSTSVNVFDFVLPSKKIALVVGNEVSGVGPENLRMCQHRVFIPMTGRKGSLNVAVAFGVASFALAQKWQHQFSASGIEE